MLPGIVAATEGGSSGGTGPELPIGVPVPLVWITPREVELDGSGNVTKFLNQGSTGSTNDATPSTANLCTIVQPASWGGQDVINIPDTGGGGYDMSNIVEARTIVAVATYQDGVQATFTNYDGLVGGGTGSSIELSGKNGTSELFFTSFPTYKNGILVPTRSVLPMDKTGIAITNSATDSAAAALFHDDFSTSRNWVGLCGDVIIFQSVLTDTQILDVHNSIMDFYA